jgi:hypothetical protein
MYKLRNPLPQTVLISMTTLRGRTMRSALHPRLADGSLAGEGGRSSGSDLEVTDAVDQ